MLQKSKLIMNRDKGVSNFDFYIHVLPQQRLPNMDFNHVQRYPFLSVNLTCVLRSSFLNVNIICVQ